MLDAEILSEKRNKIKETNFNNKNDNPSQIKESLKIIE
jgi:hypothetical protein